MITKWGSNQEYQETYAKWELDPVTLRKKYQYFEFEIPNYVDIPTEVQRFEFYIDGYGFLRDKNGYFINAHGEYIPDPNNSFIFNINTLSSKVEVSKLLDSDNFTNLYFNPTRNTIASTLNAQQNCYMLIAMSSSADASTRDLIFAIPYVRLTLVY